MMTAPVPPGMPGQPGLPPEQPSNGLGLAAMIVGIAAIPLVCCFGLGVIAGIVAVVLGFLGKQKADQGLATNRSQAMTGIICGAVAAALGLCGTVLSLLDVFTFGGSF